MAHNMIFAAIPKSTLATPRSVCYKPPSTREAATLDPNSNLNPTTSPDVQEALSNRYGNRTILVLPLSSGNLAIFGKDHQLERILPREACRPESLEYSSTEAALRLSTASAAHFFGEPDAKQLARDIRNAERPTRLLNSQTIDDLAIDL